MKEINVDLMSIFGLKPDLASENPPVIAHYDIFQLSEEEREKVREAARILRRCAKSY